MMSQRKSVRCLSLLLTVALLLTSVPALSIVATSITDTEAKVAATPGIDSYDVGHAGNLFKEYHEVLRGFQA